MRFAFRRVRSTHPTFLTHHRREEQGATTPCSSHYIKYFGKWLMVFANFSLCLSVFVVKNCNEVKQ
jgi:hypothetical protein